MSASSIGTQTANHRLAVKLSVIALLMFGFGYALVPLYNAFCEITGLNGKTAGRLSEQSAQAMAPDTTRTVTIEFVTNVNSGLPWDFKPTVAQVEVHPGVEMQVSFEAKNRAKHAIVGRAIPSVSPSAAAKFFRKTECFCFSEQPLASGEDKIMPVRFIVDPKLPADIKVLTLGYTFFESLNKAAAPADKPFPNS